MENLEQKCVSKFRKQTRHNTIIILILLMLTAFFAAIINDIADYGEIAVDILLKYEKEIGYQRSVNNKLENNIKNISKSIYNISGRNKSELDIIKEKIKIISNSILDMDVELNCFNRLAEEFTENESTKKFQRILKYKRQAVGIIYVEVPFIDITGNISFIEGGAGTAFFISEDGYLMTAKHVVHPWKYLPKLIGMMEMFNVRAGEPIIYFWIDGMRVFKSNTKELNFEDAFSTKNNKLRLEWIPNDVMIPTQGVLGKTMMVHDFVIPDIALLKVDGAEKFVFLEIAQPGSYNDLDEVMTIGYPEGFNFEYDRAVCSPVIGTIRRIENSICISPPTIPGNSGGPLLNNNGEVIGVISRRSFNEVTIGFAVKCDNFSDILQHRR